MTRVAGELVRDDQATEQADCMGDQASEGGAMRGDQARRVGC